MSDRSWSLAGRLTGLFLVGSTIFVIAISVVSAAALHQSVIRELEQLLPEELGELRGDLREIMGDHARFEAKISDFAADHPTYRMAFRIWNADGSRWGDFGATELLTDAAPDRELLNTNVSLQHGRRWRTEKVSSGEILGIVADATPEMARLKKYEIQASLLLLFGLLFTAVVGRMFFKRVSGLLSIVAEHARAVRDPDEPVKLDVPSAPREIQEVVDALREMLENIRSETNQARIFTAGMAHELRSPVQNLIGETEVALIAPRDAPTYRDVLISNLEELRSLGDAIDNLVTICSASETNRTSLREHFDLSVEAQMRLSREQAFAQRHGMKLVVVTGGDTRMHADREALLRALRNLTANAIQWNAPGATVRVEIDGARDEIVVTVDDAGPGVPVELREKIFEPFFRGPSAKGRRIGYGLGLALARTAVEDQGGRIEVGSSPAGGARFSVHLPRKTGAGATEAA